MNITVKQLKKFQACPEGIVWFKNQKKKEAKTILRKLVKENHFGWANWYVTKLFTTRQCVLYSIFNAERALENFEKEFPTDNRPRKALESAKAYLLEPSEANRSAAWAAGSAAWSAAWAAVRSAEPAESAARSAAWAAARSAAWSVESAGSAAWSVESAAWAAESAAWSAGWSVESAARSAAWAAARSAAWSVESAGSAAWSVESAAWSVESAGSAAWSAAIEKAIEILGL